MICILVTFVFFCTAMSASLDFALTKIQQFFQARRAGWLGADVATSISLSADLTLFLFGDTLVGNLNADGSRNFVSMPRNSVGLMAVGANREPSALTYYVRENVHNRSSEFTGFFDSGDGASWLWPVTGFVARDRLFLLGWQVVTDTTSGGGAFGFKFLGTSVIVTDDKFRTELPPNWRYTVHHIDGTSNDLNWCSSSLVQNDTVYLLGQSQHNTTLAKIRFHSNQVPGIM